MLIKYIIRRNFIQNFGDPVIYYDKIFFILGCQVFIQMFKARIQYHIKNEYLYY